MWVRIGQASGESGGLEFNFHKQGRACSIHFFNKMHPLPGYLLVSYLFLALPGGLGRQIFLWFFCLFVCLPLNTHLQGILLMFILKPKWGLVPLDQEKELRVSLRPGGSRPPEPQPAAGPALRPAAFRTAGWTATCAPGRCWLSLALVLRSLKPGSEPSGCFSAVGTWLSASSVVRVTEGHDLSRVPTPSGFWFPDLKTGRDHPTGSEAQAVLSR